MCGKLPRLTFALSCFFLLLGVTGAGRALYDTHITADTGIYYKTAVASPNNQWDVHNIGRIAMTITNYGVFGTGYVSSPVINGETAPSCQFPKNSNIEYLFTGSLWIGAIKGHDTLVSLGNEGWAETTPELWPDPGDAGAIISRSNLKSRSDYSGEAVSEQDFLCHFTDTVPRLSGVDRNDNRAHIPLPVSIQQNSYAWSYDYAEDFIIFDYKIANIGAYPIKELYMGMYIDADVFHKSNSATGPYDDICGFRRTVPMPQGYCISEDSINIAWIADNDGDPTNGAWTFASPVAVTGTRVLRTPNKNLKYSFNWWVSNTSPEYDFGPRLAGTDTDPFRAFGAYKGTPTGDKNKYYVMRHEEFDYDQLFTAVSHTGEGFEPPPKPDLATDIANGFDTRYLLSFGPFDVQPGDTLPITLAYVAGDKFHVGPDDFKNYFDAFNPNAFYSKLDFTDLGLNARWADWIYDNPGYDTDGDGDSGQYCWKYVWKDTTASGVGDTVITDSTKIYYRGDGVPDFRGAAPPPAPTVKVIPGYGKVTLRWNGQISENAQDVFSGSKDFEGYRVYYAQGSRATDYVRLASYDLDDYKVFEFNITLRTWDQVSAPLTRDSLTTLYGSSFDPTHYYDEYHYFTDPVTATQKYFVAQDWNQSDLTNPLAIHKVYPNASKSDPSDTTTDGYMRYYEYEYKIANLEPSIAYYFAVTAFDYGSLKVDLGSLETSPTINAVREFPLPPADTVEAEGLKVTVYPNPYRINGGYASAGYENRDRTKSAERTRAINFANLPKVCTIRIFSPTGDLIQQIEHNHPDGGPGSQHETWNVISRNTQAVVTGIYLWHVQSAMGEQIGKLVIIK